MKLNLIIAMATAVLSAGCGGALSKIGGDDDTTPAKFAGLHRLIPHGTACNINTVKVEYGMPVNHFQYQAGVLVDEDNTGFFVCGDQLWVGKFSGTLTNTVGTGSVEFIRYANGKTALGTTGKLTGAILTSNGVVNHIDFYDTAGQFEFKAVAPDSPGVQVTTITKSYATLAGHFTGGGASVDIDQNGLITGSAGTDAIAGQITRFNSATGVHSVSVTITPAGGAPLKLAGVLGPYNGSSVAGQYGAVQLALAGGGIGYFKLLAHP